MATPDVPKSIERFLTVLALSGNPSVACRASAMTRREVDLLRRCDADFSQAFEDAIEEAADVMEAEAWRRAIEGVAEPIVRAGKPVVDPATGHTMMARRYSDALLMVLLRASRPGKFALRPTSPTPDNVGEIIKEIAADDDPPRRKAGAARKGRS